MTSSRLLAALLLLGLSMPALGHDDEKPADAKPDKAQAAEKAPIRENMCHEDPESCKSLKARRDEFCKKNPATCEKRRKQREAIRAWCDENPEECDDAIAERKARVEKRRRD